MKNRYLIEIITEDLPIADLNENFNIINDYLKNNINKNKIKFSIFFVTYKRFIFLFISDLNVDNYLKSFIENIFFLLKFTINMRWKNNLKTFIRPVISYLFLLNDKVIKHLMFGQESSNKTIIFKKHRKYILNVNSFNYFEVLNKYNIFYDKNIRYKHFLKKIYNYLNIIKGNIVVDNNILIKLSNSFEIFGLKFIKVNFKKLELNNRILTKILLSNFYLPVIKNNTIIGFFLVTDGIFNKKIITSYKKSILLKIIYFKKIYFNDFKLINFKKFRKTILNENFDTLYIKSKRLYFVSKYFSKYIKFNLLIVRKMIILINSEFLTKFIYEDSSLNGLLFIDNRKYCHLKKFLFDYNSHFIGKDSIYNESKVLIFLENFDDLINLFILNKFPKGKKDPFNVKKKINLVLSIFVKNKISINLKYFLLKIKYIFFFNKNFNINEFFLILIDKMKSNFSCKYINLIKDNGNLYKLYLYSKFLNNFFKFKFKNNLFSLIKRINNIINKNNCNILKKLNRKLFLNLYEKKLFIKFTKIVKMNNLLKKKGRVFSMFKNFLTIENDLNNFFSHTFILDKNFDISNNRLKLLKMIKYFINKNVNFNIESMK